MDFWQVIEDACDRPLSVEAASQRLESRLREMPPTEVELFCRKFDELMNDACRWDLWGVAYLINGGCSDDAFMDFRSSLIALGRKTFLHTLSDPEALLELPAEELQALFEEGLLYCGPRAFESLTGAQPSRVGDAKTEPDGQPWDETPESLSVRFPRAWAVYGWEAQAPAAIDVPKKRPWWNFW